MIFAKITIAIFSNFIEQNMIIKCLRITLYIDYGAFKKKKNKYY